MCVCVCVVCVCVCVCVCGGGWVCNKAALTLSPGRQLGVETVQRQQIEGRQAEVEERAQSLEEERKKER